MAYVRTLWDSASHLTAIQLTGANIGYPLEYDDVLQRQIQAFKRSPEWQAHLNQHGKQLNYELMRKIMIENHVYAPFEALLAEFGYAITGLSTEKHGFVPKEALKQMGEDTSTVVPIPFMVLLTLTPLQGF